MIIIIIGSYIGFLLASLTTLILKCFWLYMTDLDSLSLTHDGKPDSVKFKLDKALKK